VRNEADEFWESRPLQSFRGDGFFCLDFSEHDFAKRGRMGAKGHPKGGLEMSEAQDGAARTTGSELRTLALIIGMVVGIGSLLVCGITALATAGDVLFKVCTHFEAAKDKRIFEFQQVMVSGIVADFGRDGVKLSRLQDEFAYECRRAKLPQAYLGDDQLDLILFSLREKNVITRVGTDRFRMVSEWQPIVKKQPLVETPSAPSPASSTTPPATAKSYASTPPSADVLQGIFQPPHYRRVAARPTESTPAWVRE
jgi:hypothetical protein